MINQRVYVPFLMDTGLTQAQFLLLYLIYKEDKFMIEKYKARFPTEDGSMIGKYQTDSLFNEGWLEKDVTGRVFVTDKFKAHFIVDGEALRELLEHYPAFMEIRGANVPLLAIDTDRMEGVYGRKIYFSFLEHQEVLEDLHYGIENNYIRFGIQKFIEGELWIPLRRLRLNKTDNIPDEFSQDFEEDF